MPDPDNDHADLLVFASPGAIGATTRIGRALCFISSRKKLFLKFCRRQRARIRFSRHLCRGVGGRPGYAEGPRSYACRAAAGKDPLPFESNRAASMAQALAALAASMRRMPPARSFSAARP